MMETLLTHTSDIAVRAREIDGAADPTQPVIIPDGLPAIIKKRFDQALRVNTRADWKEFARLCSITAIGFFQDNNYDPNNADFKSVCQLARIGHLRGMQCLAQGVSMPRPSRARVGL